VADRSDANCLFAVGNLVDDAVGADAERTQSLEATAQRVSGEGLAFEQPEGFLDGVDERPVEFEQLAPGAASENDTSHRSAGRATLGQLAAEVCKRDGLVARELGEASFDRGKRLGIGEDLCGLLERLVLVDGNKRGGRPAIAGDQDVIAAIGDVTQ
jgi:hypothetical protein